MHCCCVRSVNAGAEPAYDYGACAEIAPNLPTLSRGDISIGSPLSTLRSVHGCRSSSTCR